MKNWKQTSEGASINFDNVAILFFNIFFIYIEANYSSLSNRALIIYRIPKLKNLWEVELIDFTLILELDKLYLQLEIQFAFQSSYYFTARSIHVYMFKGLIYILFYLKYSFLLKKKKRKKINKVNSDLYPGFDKHIDVPPSTFVDSARTWPTPRRPKSPFLLLSFKHHPGRYLHPVLHVRYPCAYIFMRRWADTTVRRRDKLATLNSASITCSRRMIMFND